MLVGCYAQVKEWMHRSSGVPMEELERHMFLLRDRDATQHLMEVSGGLDSLIKGEGQILAQVCPLLYFRTSADCRSAQHTAPYNPVISNTCLGALPELWKWMGSTC